METQGDSCQGQCPDVVHVKEEPEHPPPLNCEPTIPRGNLYHSHHILGSCSTITAENHVEAHRQGQQVGLMKEEPLEHSPQLSGARTFNVHIKEEPKETSVVHDVKEEALCVDEGELQSSGSHGVSAAAMLAGLYTDHIVKDELLLGPELLHRPNVSQSGEEPDMKPECVDDDPESDAGPAQVFQVAEPASCVSARAREQLAARCSVRLERLQVQEAGQGTLSLLTHLTDCDKSDHTYKPKLHQNIHIGAKAFQCDHCNYKCSCKTNLQRHLMIHTVKKPFQCDHCNYRFRQKFDLQRHLRIHTGEKPFQCDHCDYRFSRKNNLQSHMMIHIFKKPFQCDHCDYKCSRKTDLQRHLMIHTGKKPFQCDHCDYKFSQKTHLERHLMIHTGKKPFQCDHCDYKCSLKRSLQIHLRIHTGEKPFQCDHCDYKCRQKSHLQRHLMIHTGKKPFQCDHCDYKCSLKRSLQIHLRIHTGDKPFQCDHCDYRFTRKLHLQRHLMIHSGEKLFQCDHCDYKCRRKTHLQRHLRIHTGGNE